MGAAAIPVQIRQTLMSRLAKARARTDELFAIVRPEAFYDRPIPERHRVIFYLGHLETFDWNLLGRDVFGLDPFHQEFDRLFAFGIDPVSGKTVRQLLENVNDPRGIHRSGPPLR